MDPASWPQSVDHPVDESLLAEAMGCQVDEDVRHSLDGIRKPEVQQAAVALNELDHAHEGRPLVPIRKWVVLDDPGAQDGRLFGEPRVSLEVSEAGAGDVQGGISLGDDPLGAPEHLGRDPRYGLGDKQEVAEFEVLPMG